MGYTVGKAKFLVETKEDDVGKMKELTELEVKVGLSVGELVAALRGLSDEDREFFIENLLAATSPDYLESIKQARKDYKEGRTVPYEELFKQ